jgi:c-di-GMP-binding flagellar brake protein YcgR
MTEERRNHPRIKVAHPVVFHTDMERKPRLGLTVDLSMGGTQIESVYSLTNHEGLELSIHTDLLIIACRGKVMYVLEPDSGNVKAGIKFETLSEYDRLYLRHYLFHIMDQRTLEPSLSLV